MIDRSVVNKQLRRIGAEKSFWGQPDLAQLPKILIEGEIVEHVRHGRYKGGFATLVATNHRLLLVDKKPFFLTVEDIRYDMIAEVDYGHQFVGGTIHVRSFSNDLMFQSLDKKSLYKITGFIQHKVMEQRGHQVDHIKSLSNQTVARQAIPMQVFDNGTELTDQQADGLVPLDKETWYKLRSSRHPINPYTQTPLMTRRRVGRFNFVNNK